MKIILITFLLFLITDYTTAQTTAIPDYEFELRLINQGYDVGVPDGFVPTANIDTITNFVVSSGLSPWIWDLKGIEDFTALTRLICDGNKIDSLDLSQNTNLVELDASNNGLIYVNLTQNTALTILDLSYNFLSVLDLTPNSALENLRIDKSELLSLDLSQNSNLTKFVGMQNPQLECVNLKNGNNANITSCFILACPNLVCVQVDDSVAGVPFSTFQSGIIITENCQSPCSFVSIKEDVMLENYINIYPNPVNDLLYIDYDKPVNEIGIFDIAGKIVLSIVKDNNSIDVSDLSRGIYFLQLTTEKRIVTKKFIKQ